MPRLGPLKKRSLMIAFRRFQKWTDREDFDHFVRPSSIGLKISLCLRSLNLHLMAAMAGMNGLKPLKTGNAHAIEGILAKNSSALERVKFIQYIFFKSMA